MWKKINILIYSTKVDGLVVSIVNGPSLFHKVTSSTHIVSEDLNSLCYVTLLWCGDTLWLLAS